MSQSSPSSPLEVLSCPSDASRPPRSLPELRDDATSLDAEQRFCCGPPGQKYCCDAEQKVDEDPLFDPTHGGVGVGVGAGVGGDEDGGDGDDDDDGINQERIP